MKGIAFGLLYQVVVAIGLVWISGVGRNASAIVKANVMLCIAGAIGAVIVAVTAIIRGTSEMSLSRFDVVQLGIAAILILVIGESAYLMGLAVSNATTVAYTALAFPLVCLLLDTLIGRVSLSSLTIRDYAGAAFLVVGFVLLCSRTND